MKAKSVSLWVIILAVVWVGVLVLAMAFTPVFADGKALGIGLTEILMSAGFFVVACTPIYRSIWLDKKFGLNTENKVIVNTACETIIGSETESDTLVSEDVEKLR